MIPYVPEGPPPLDEEDSGSPVDAPVGFLTVLQSLGAPASTFTSTSINAESQFKPEPPIKREVDKTYFDEFQSAPINPLSLSSSSHSSLKLDEKIHTATQNSDTPQETVPKDSIVNGFPPPTTSDVLDDDEFGDFGDFRSVPVDVELRKSVVEEESDLEEKRDEPESEAEDAFDDFQQADSNESDAAVVVNSDEQESEGEKGRSPSAAITSDRSSPKAEQLGTISVRDGDETAEVNARATSSPAQQSEDEFETFHEVDRETKERGDVNTVSMAKENVFAAVSVSKENDQKEELNANEGDSEPKHTENVVIKEGKFEASKAEEEGDGDFADFGTFRAGEEFAAFKDAENNFEERDTEFGDFRDGEEAGDFGLFKSNDINLKVSNSEGTAAAVDEEDDEFGGFHSLREGNRTAAEDGDFGDFAAFSQADGFNAFEEGSKAKEEEEGFGEFSQSDDWASEEKFDAAPAFPTFEPSVPLTDAKIGEKEPHSLLERILANMEKVLSNCYASADELPDDTAPLTDLSPNGNVKTDLQEGDADTDDAALWGLLIDFDKAFALQYQLAKSLGNECFLKALNIDSRNVLKNPRKPTLPVFASQLGLLEPTRGATHEHGAPATAAAVLASMAATDVPGGGGAVDGEPSIPASEFDWTSSGLTNPLDSTNSNFYLDLDFFETSQLNLSAGMGRVKSELEEQFLCKELIAPPGAGLEVKLDPVQSILTRVRGSSGAATKVETELSSEARAYLDRLANLDYMKARVLMFPIGHS